MTHDLVLKGGRVLDPGNGTDRVTDIAFANGRVAAIGDGLTAHEIQDASNCIVTPGLIDLHTHVYWGGTSLGVDPDTYMRACGATTLVDTGSAGPGNFAGFKAHVIDRATPRILVYLHISFAGIFAFSRTIMVGESQDIRLMAVDDAIAVAKQFPEDIIGIKVRVGKHTSGPNGITPLILALEVADACDLPIMAHIDEPDPTYDEVVNLLRPGDVLTHCFRPFPNAPVYRNGQVREAILQARERGVLFDIGHGMGAFSWRSAEAMMAAGFAPDTVSSDVHTLCIDGPAKHLIYTMNKLLAVGMPLPDLVAATTINPARAIRRDALGQFQPGGVGDATVFQVLDEPIRLEDVKGDMRVCDQTLRAHALIRNGTFIGVGE